VTGAETLACEPYAPLFRNPDLMTVVGRYWPVSLEPGEPRRFATEPGVQVSGRCHWRHPDGPVMLLVHGLEGSVDSNYMRSMTVLAQQAGFDVVRLNVRNCGGSEPLAPTLYHSGLTADLRAVVEQFATRRLCVVGFSMGGNQALKLAGEWGERPPEHVASVCSISAPIDLAACARRLGEPRNRIYEHHFLRSLGARLRRKARLMPDRFTVEPLERVRSIIDFDDHVTAPAFGYDGALDYYARCSARKYLKAIRVPTLLIQAHDDPFIPFETYELPPNPALRLIAPEFGGHVAFLSRHPPRFWAAAQAVRFCQSCL